jgi:hypothetical protein
MSSETITCEICCGERSKFITCLFCKNSACNTCQETYLLTQLYPRCMNCNKQWSSEFLQNNFSKVFINKKYKDHRKVILFEIEKSLLPETQRYVQLENQIKQTEDDIRLYKQIIDNLKLKHTKLTEKLYRRNEEQKEEQDEEKNEDELVDTKCCPVENCRGYLTNKYTCGICNIKVCSKCLELKGNEEHKCNEDTLNSLKLIRSDSKNCPKCNAFVHKTQGCDVMWCTYCKTPFNWKTCKIIVDGAIHNPHYFEYLQTIGEDTREVARIFGENRVRNISTINEGNIFCIRLQDLLYLSSNFRFIDKYHDILEFARIIMHVGDVDVGKFEPVNLEEKNLDIRKQYLNKEIDEKQFQSLIYRRQKNYEYKNEVYLLLQMYVTLCREEFCKLFLYMKQLYHQNRRVYSILRDNEYLQFINKVKNIQKYFKDHLEKICSRYNYKMPNTFALDTTCIQNLETVKTK